MAEDRSDIGVRSVQIALDVLEAIAFSGEEFGVTQLAERLKITKGSVHRHLLTLVERGYLVQNPVTARYAIGAKGRLLARLAPDADLVDIAAGPMRELRDRLGQSVVLSEVTPRGALVLNTVPGTAAIEIGVRPGSELAFHASAQGKILLAFSPRPQQERVLARPLSALRCIPSSIRRASRKRSRAPSASAMPRPRRRRCSASMPSRRQFSSQGRMRRRGSAGRLDPVPTRPAGSCEHFSLEGNSRPNLAQAGSRPPRNDQGSAVDPTENGIGVSCHRLALSCRQ